MPPQPLFTPVPDPAPEALAAVRARFEKGEITQGAAAAELAMSVQTFRKRAEGRWGWRIPDRLRRSSKLKRKPPPKGRGARRRVSPRRKLTPLQHYETLMDNITLFMDAIEANIGTDGLPIDLEQHGKLVAQSLKLQADAARLKSLIDPKAGARGDDDDEPLAPSEVARLRDELAAWLTGAPPAGGGQRGPEVVPAAPDRTPA